MILFSRNMTVNDVKKHLLPVINDEPSSIKSTPESLFDLGSPIKVLFSDIKRFELFIFHRNWRKIKVLFPWFPYFKDRDGAKNFKSWLKFLLIFKYSTLLLTCANAMHE